MKYLTVKNKNLDNLNSVTLISTSVISALFVIQCIHLIIVKEETLPIVLASISLFVFSTFIILNFISIYLIIKRKQYLKHQKK